ncbi:HET domain-containing protein [Purpureocillium lavendulum]|uniref:HET domain-containing protein n=1 Tax=Purpureocillium lavendulum TaxID=1247861 RepID=A0AB34FL37_9HYPO|nr:HET domain-containing protein [Purpureocillium lavendulum]
MRLIHTKNLDVEEFFDIHVPEYAILSHTWADGEVSLQDWADRNNRRFKPGFQKIVKACAEAAKDGISYIWVDTNCIDKTSSAELSEAVNSMFKWYQRSVVCYAHLEDVPHATIEDCSAEGSDFRKAKWFTRGWTLQELIAPAAVKFFSKDWLEIGTKADMTLALTISEVTGISAWCLRRGMFSKLNPLRGYSVAQRLSWASSRSTTRVEDQAYSLLGLFDISMPLVYGEGSEAFTRLLEEIMRKYTDHSVLASQLRYVDFLPRSPKEFCESQFVATGKSTHLKKHYTPLVHSYPFQMTNSGLQMTLPIVATLAPAFVFGVLDCWDATSGTTQTTRSLSRIWIPLMRKGPERIRQFTRLLWPSPFVPVRLVTNHEVNSNQKSDRWDQAKSSTAMASLVREDAASWPIDLVSPESHQDILIQKPYATTLSVPKWQPREAGSPFLICLPRGAAGYRLYGVFPQSAEADEQLRQQLSSGLPLVQSRRLATTPGKDQEIYGAIIVFKQRQSRPPRFIAACLANIPKADENGAITYEPSCKIVPDWNPGLETSEDGGWFREGFGPFDAHGDFLVAVQNVPCPSNASAKGLGCRFVGLTQIAFDRRELIAEQTRLSALNAFTMPGMLAHMGKACSDDE